MADENITTSDYDPDEFGQVFFAWEVSQYPEHKRTTTWYLVMVILALALIIYSIITANFLFALIIILVTFIIFLRSNESAQKFLFQITEDGILLGNQFISYGALKGFYIIYDPPAVKKLFLELKGIYPDISIALGNENPLPVRDKLLDYLDEDLQKEFQSADDQIETIFKL